MVNEYFFEFFNILTHFTNASIFKVSLRLDLFLDFTMTHNHLFICYIRLGSNLIWFFLCLLFFRSTHTFEEEGILLILAWSLLDHGIRIKLLLLAIPFRIVLYASQTLLIRLVGLQGSQDVFVGSFAWVDHVEKGKESVNVIVVLWVNLILQVIEDLIDDVIASLSNSCF